jgi:hypothetical protein
VSSLRRFFPHVLQSQTYVGQRHGVRANAHRVKDDFRRGDDRAGMCVCGMSVSGVLVRLSEAGELRGLERGVVRRREDVRCEERGAL